MTKLRVQQVARAQGKEWTISELQRKAGIQMTTARRYWYSTRDGKENGAPINEIDLSVLKQIADALGVKPLELMEDDRRALVVAFA